MESGIFEIKDQFYLNGQPFKIISGGIHYFRVVPEYWHDRLIKLKAMGCNTVETYVPWNWHEPEKGRFCFEGRKDLRKFILLAQELGLYVIVRPSPYICAEWEFGGLPGWLLADDTMRLRSYYGPFLNHVREYYRELFKILKPLQINYGGPVILMQVENEYGYYGEDSRYMEEIRKIMIDNGTVVPLVTSDGPTEESLSCGSIEGALPTGNFGSRTRERFQVLEKYTNGGPLMCTEFWVGWFDHWGNGGHMKGNLEESAADLDQMLKLGSVNIYMFEGGTNFGFMNGSNYYDELTPDVTSYDYDAVLTEAGDTTEKYNRYREIIGTYAPLPEIALPAPAAKVSYGVLRAEARVGLFEALPGIALPVRSPFPQPMEKLGQYYGYILYRSRLKRERSLEKIRLYGANDRAGIYLDGKHAATLYDRELLEERELNIAFEDADAEPALDILVENMGRVNFGPRMEDQRKGIGRCVQINGHIHYDWEHYCLPLDNLECLDFTKGYTEGTPGFYRFSFEAETIGDTFLDLEGWGKGCAFLNGFHLGRFWEIGPQKRLYIPGPLVKPGRNEIILFETEGRAGDTIALRDLPDIG